MSIKKTLARGVLLLAIVFINSTLLAQDKEFWFAAPDISEQEGCGPFDSPMVFAISNATETEGKIQITFYNNGTLIVENGVVPAGGLYKYDITKLTRGQVENPRSAAGTVTKYGVHITSSVPVTIYYQTLAPCNQDIFSLKGSAALGKDFYVPMIHDSYYHTGEGYTVPVPYDQIDIVATEDNTDIFVTPTKVIRIGASGSAPLGVEKKWTLNKGETLKIMEHITGTTIGSASLGGTKIRSTKPIAVTTSEDLIGRTGGGTGWDIIGDQIVPIDALGNNYVVIKGFLAGSDRAYIVATQDGTTVTVNNGTTSTPISLNAGGCSVADLGTGGNANSAPQAISITANKPIYCYHISGARYSGDELGSGLLPSIYSIGQRQLSFYQYYQPGESHYAFVVFRTGAHNKFSIKYGTGAFQAIAAGVNVINIPGLSDWKAAKIPITTSTASRVITLKNSESPFSFGFFSLNSSTGGASYGFLSAFGDFKFADSTFKCKDKVVTLDGGYALTYKWWKGKKENEPADGSGLVLSTANTYNVPAGESGNYYSVRVNHDPQFKYATTYIAIDTFKVKTTIPKYIQKGVSENLSVAVRRNEGKTYQWTTTGTTPATPTMATTTTQWNAIGTYEASIKVTNDLGCDTTYRQAVYVYDIQDDYLQTIIGIPVTADVLVNDVFPGCDTPTLTIATQGTKGTASIQAGKLVYTPTTTGSDVVTYKVTCGTLVATAKVYIYVAEKPDNISDADCYVNPEAKDFTIKEHGSYGKIGDYYKVHSMSTPLVANLSGNGPEIVVPRAYNGNSWGWSGGLVIVNVKNNTTREINTVNFATHGQALAIADVDGDGVCEIFIQSAEDSRIYCYNPDGTAKTGFTTTQVTDDHYIIQLADLNGDKNVELIAGPYIFNAKTGTLLLKMTFETGGTGYGNPHGLTKPHQGLAYGGYYYMPMVGDVDGDGHQEIVAGGIVYKPNPTFSSYTTTKVNTTGTPAAFNKWLDGPTVLVDFDKDGQLDVCVIGHQTLASNSTIQFYVWNPRTREVIAYAPGVTAVGYGITIPYVGDLDNNGYPDFAFATTGIGMMSYQYDNTQPGNIKPGPKVPAFAETAGFTMFDFNQDGKSDIVYRGYNTFYIVNLKDDGSGYENLTPPTATHSGTVAEYPIVADVDEDGQAEIILARSPNPWNGSNLQGVVSVYKAADASKPWAPARKVWNQWAYNGTNINEDMTVPQHPINPAAIFPNGKQPYNGFLQQVTQLNANGDMLYLAPEASFDGSPAYTWRSDNNTLEIKVKVKNIGDADLQAPVYATAYKDAIAAANKLATGSCVTNIAPNATGELTIVVPNINDKLPISSIHIRINDNDGTYPVQQQCRYDNNTSLKTLAQVPVAINDTTKVRSNEPITVDVLANDIYGCSLANMVVSIVPPITANGTASINSSTKKMEYRSNTGFSDEDKIYYKIKCNDSEDASIAISHMVIHKPVKVEIVGSGTADENGLATAQLKFLFTDNVTHQKPIKVTYLIEAGSTAVLNDDYTLSPTPYTVIIPQGQREVLLTLTPKQNYIVQGSRDVKITIINVEEQ